MSDELDPVLRAVDLLTPAFTASDLEELEVESGTLVKRQQPVLEIDPS